MRALLVEDSEKLQRAIRLALRKSGFAVDVTGDGEEGFWLARENDYDAVILREGDLEIDTVARAVTREGAAIGLTAREYRLLEFLAHRRGEVVTRSEIEEHVYGDETEIFSNTVESTISALRKKLDRPGSAPLIHTRRGMGYVLEAGIQ